MDLLQNKMTVLISIAACESQIPFFSVPEFSCFGHLQDKKRYRFKIYTDDNIVGQCDIENDAHTECRFLIFAIIWLLHSPVL